MTWLSTSLIKTKWYRLKAKQQLIKCMKKVYSWAGGWMNGWMDEWVGGWVEVKAILWIAYSNKIQGSIIRSTIFIK